MAEEQVILRTMSNLTALEYEDGSHVLRVSAAGSAAGGQQTTLRTLYNVRAIQHDDGSHTPVVSVEGGEEGPVYSVNGESGNVSLTAAKIGAATAAQGETADAASAAVASEAEARRALIDQVGSGDLVVTNEAGMGIARIHAGGAELPGLAVDKTADGKLTVANEAGFVLDDPFAAVDRAAAVTGQILAPPMATVQRPWERIANIGGFLRARDAERPVTPSPYVRVPPLILPASSAAGAPYSARTSATVPTIAHIPRADGSVGRIFIAYYAHESRTDWGTNPYGEGPGNYLVMAYSDDEGDTWHDAYYLVSDPSINKGRLYDPILFGWQGRLCIRYGNISGIQGYSLGIQDQYDGCWAGWLENPLADPDHFVHSAHYYSLMGQPSNPFIWNGLPYWSRTCAQGAFGVHPSLSQYEGRFVDRFWVDEGVFEPVLLMPVDAAALISFPEQHLVQLTQGGNLLAHWRTTQGVYQATYTRSTGQWSAPESLAPVIGTNPASRSWLGRSPTGRLVMIYNNATNRTNMTIALSEDDGATWPVGLRAVLRTGTSSYPDAVFGPGGKIYITTDSRYSNPDNILFYRVDEQNIVDGTPSITTVTVETAATRP